MDGSKMEKSHETMSREISAHDLGEYRIQQLIDAAVRRGFTAEELEDLEERAIKAHPSKHKLKEENETHTTDTE